MDVPVQYFQSIIAMYSAVTIGGLAFYAAAVAVVVIVFNR